MLLTILLLIAMTTILSRAREPTGSYLSLYGSKNHRGQIKVISRNRGFFRTIGCDNAASSFCVFKGVFIMYQDEQYNLGTEGGSIWSWSYDKHCFDMEPDFEKTISSAKYVGVLDKPWDGSIDFFSQEGFGGIHHSATYDKPRLHFDQVASSIVVLGCWPWTLYEHKEYEGKARCILPGNNFRPAFYPRSEGLGGFANVVSSVRKGCHVPENFYTSPFRAGIRKTDRNFTSGMGSIML